MLENVIPCGVFQVMLSSRLGVLGRLVANNVEEAKEAGAESVHPRMKSHVLMIPQRKKTVTLSLVHRTVCSVNLIRITKCY